MTMGGSSSTTKAMKEEEEAPKDEETPSSMADETPQTHEEADETGENTSNAKKLKYNWRLYSPHGNGRNPIRFFRWFINGGTKHAKQTDEAMKDNLHKLARCITYLREYHSLYGMPEEGGPRDQAYVLRQVVRDLYSGGAPIWALEPVMEKVVQGLTGAVGANWCFLPRKVSVYTPVTGTNVMFSIERGFAIQQLQDMEKIAVKLCSYASNTSGVANVPSRFPHHDELNQLARQQHGPARMQRNEQTFRRSVRRTVGLELGSDQEELAKIILSLTSESHGVYNFLNCKEYHEKHCTHHHVDGAPLDEFWIISDQERELFSRLATIDAMNAIERIDEEHSSTQLYSPLTLLLFRFLSAGGSAAFWFGGSWQDMIVAGALNVVVGLIAQWRLVTRHERVILEMIAGFLVGLTAGLIALKWPDQICAGAIALGALIDLFQGFRVVCAVIETMGKHTVAGAADLIEAVLYTTLIAYCLRFGQSIAGKITTGQDYVEYPECSNGVSEYWFILLVPLSAIGWSGLFAPHRKDLPMMCFHGCLAYVVNFWLGRAVTNVFLTNFVAAVCVTFSAGIISRFTGHSAVGNTTAGLWALVPGAYMVESFFMFHVNSNFVSDIVHHAVVIGIGAWTGTLLCSPTVLGTTKNAMVQQMSSRVTGSDRERKKRHENDNPNYNKALFFF